MEETEFPGNPNASLPWIFPNTSGCPGRMASFQKFISAPMSLNTALVKSDSPNDTPPDSTRTSAFRPCAIFSFKAAG